MPYSLYIHIPYCKSRCRYCDFYTAATGGAVPDTYLDALENAFRRHAPKGADGAPGRPATVYFGGGTPSLLAPAQTARLLAMANPLPGAEVTLEANPESATLEKLSAFRAAGVNRLSLGVQSANDAQLRTLGRLHTAAQARAAFAAARTAGFENISGDIMLALPGYTSAEFERTLGLIRDGGATHISAYLLKLEPGTPLAQSPPKNLPDADAAADFYLHAAAALEKAGYAQYEISNFAQPGFEGWHNLVYWDAGDWLGLGPAAHSCLFGRRFSFAADTAGFIKAQGMVEATAEGTLAAEDYMMLRLRLSAGLDEEALLARWGVSLSEKQRGFLDALCRQGLARKTPGGWALTPAGMLVQNSILARLL
ncbi:radical SAM family heme chaperone HemW [Ruminococcaceae bacterium OttesenSCG-928-D13]|nr:radical SAM family heme chaperone HemW [Ruminococcaceae bacterium OttesenSCG-928-D13]